MRRVNETVIALALAWILLVPAGTMAGELEGLHGEINVRARADLGAFKADLSATFGLPGPRIDELFEVLPSPADVYLTLRVGEVAHRPLAQVVDEFKRNRGQGWGVIAKNLGIKPGSSEFHALKQGRLSFGPTTGPAGSKNKSKSKGKGKK